MVSKWTNEKQKPVNEQYRSNYDSIFKKKEKQDDNRNEREAESDSKPKEMGS